MSTDFSAKSVFKATWRILKLARPLRKMIFLVLFFTAVASLFQLLGLGLIIPVLNGLVDPNHYEALLKTPRFAPYVEYAPFELNNRNIFIFIVGLVLLASYLENFFLYIGQKFSAHFSMLVAHRLRRKVFERFLGFGKAFYDRSNLGELNVLLTTFITGVGQHLYFMSQLLVLSLFSAAFLTLMLIISWRLTLIAFVLLPLTHQVSTWLSHKLKFSAEGEAKHMVDLSHHSLEVLQNMQLTQFSGSQAKELDQLSGLSDKVRLFGATSRARGFLIPRCVDIINITGIIFLACGAVFLFFKGEAASIGRLSAFFIALRRFTSHIELIVSIWANCLGKMPIISRVLWVFDDSDKPMIKDDGKKEFPGIKDELAFNNVRFSYDGTIPIIRKVSLEIKPGTMTAIVGPTGAGKTTLINLIPRFYDPSAGSVEIDGIDIREYSLESLRSKIAIVSQHTMLFHDTIKSNVLYGLEDIEESAVFDALEKARLSDFVKRLPNGINTRIGKDGVQLSGGEKQRLSIARAILRDPEILLLDEATSALDAETESEIQAAIEGLVSDRTVLVIAHRLSTVSKADQIVVIEEGKIVEQGTPEELRSLEGIFHRYCELQRIFH